MIELKNVCTCRGGQPVLRDFSGCFSEGITAILGPASGGRNDLLRVLAGVASPRSGQILWDGVPLSSRRRRLAVGYLPARFDFYGFLRVEEVLAQAHALRGLPRKNRPRQIALALEQVGLQELGESHVSSLDGDAHRRLALAVALLGDPDTLLLAGPERELAPDSALLIGARLRDWGRRKTVLLASGDPLFAGALAEQFLLLRGGALFCRGDRREAASWAEGRTFHLPAGLDLPEDALVTGRVLVDGRPFTRFLSARQTVGEQVEPTPGEGCLCALQGLIRKEVGGDA